MSDENDDGRAGDPFDRLDDDAKREGDPFEWLPDAGERDDGERHVAGGPADPEDDDGGPDGASGPNGDPLDGVETPPGSPFDGDGGVFERVETGSVDPDAVWESITGEGDDADDVPPADDDRYADVDKHRYCERCEFFAAPPAATCTHETAEIIEFLDMDTVRVFECPVVARRAALDSGE